MSNGGTPSTDNLSVVPEKVREVGEQVYELSMALRTALDSAAKDVESLVNGTWRGNLASQFADGWTDIRDGGAQIITALSGMAEKLGVTASTYEDLDGSNAAVLYNASSSSLDLP
ncbi:type VII secretion target [Nocardia sp. NPDC051929]|uniref:type VII secretion target n=1 Tax=Nocardia sp. NPDC051929 TaxID=3364327 RepID=UPI0037C83AB1